ncbi:hypothetical protein [Leifsonia sp. A12D58]|uniref:hypothetical protein n=1 Tax=Leifsonia sp. A12D58 TaxID=3397674 RepID=UPI0039E1111C
MNFTAGKLATPPTPPTGLRRSERIALSFLAAVTAVFGILVLVSAITQAISLAFDPHTQMSLSTNAQVPSGAATGTASLVQGTFSTATVTLAGISAAARAFLSGGTLVNGLMLATLAAAFTYLCVGLIRGRPFSRHATWLLATASTTLVLGGVITLGLSSIGQFMVAGELNADPSNTIFPMASTVSLMPIFAGIALGAIAAAFEFGQRLQRDTEGLV